MRSQNFGRAIWLDGGQMSPRRNRAQGGPLITYSIPSQRCRAGFGKTLLRHRATTKCDSQRAGLRPATGRCRRPADDLHAFVIEFEYWNLQTRRTLDISLHIYNEQGISLSIPGRFTNLVWHGREFPGGTVRSACFVPGNLLNDGMYRVELLVVRDEGVIVHREEEALVLRCAM